MPRPAGCDSRITLNEFEFDIQLASDEAKANANQIQ